MSLLSRALTALRLRGEVEELLRVNGPLRVVIDTSLPGGDWYVVRGESLQEKAERVARDEAWRRAQEEKRRQAAEDDR